MTKLNIVMAQQNYTIGDVDGIADKIIATIDSCRGSADIILFSELTITAYPPEDLLLRPEFQAKAAEALARVAAAVKDDLYIVIGHPHKVGDRLFNAASVIHDGRVIKRYYKQRLPNYSVFDEKRYFTRGSEAAIVDIKGVAVGIVICEDLWHPGVLKQAKDAGAEMILSLNASPFNFEKHTTRQHTIQERQASEGHIPVVYVNGVGGQDELIFDGQSFAADGHGNLCARAPAFEESLLPVTVEIEPKLHMLKGHIEPLKSEEALIYQALVCSTRDYVNKNGFSGILVGLSGGIDSALATTIACDAIGSNRVSAILMPSRYTSDISIEDGVQLAKNLGIEHSIISIEPTFKALLKDLESEVGESIAATTAAENLQSRCRAAIIMALSNLTGKMVLNTGNKSEMAVGYATLYGDMVGGYAVLRDVLKTLVYKLAHYRNSISAVIPARIIERPPSAELAHDQIDEDKLPPYSTIDAIIMQYVDKNRSASKIIESGLDPAAVNYVVTMIDKSEYKRRQAPPGVRISHRSFGRDWRYPITSNFQKGVKLDSNKD